MRDFISIFISIPNLILLISISPTQTTAQTLGFRCTTTTCNSLIDYKLRNTTTRSTIATIFQIKNLRSLIAANNLRTTAPSTSSSPTTACTISPPRCSPAW